MIKVSRFVHAYVNAVAALFFSLVAMRKVEGFNVHGLDLMYWFFTAGFALFAVLSLFAPEVE